MEWHDRIQRSAKHYLGALMFLESAIATFEKAETTLLSSTGLYYSGFHVGVALLWLADDRTPDDLKQMRHSQLRAYLMQSYVQQGLLENDFLDDLMRVQDLREYANYRIGSKVPEHWFRSEFPTHRDISERLLQVGTEAIHKKLPLLYATHDLGSSFETAIGDGFGDEVMRLHVGKDIENKVVNRLLAARLTT